MIKTWYRKSDGAPLVAVPVLPIVDAGPVEAGSTPDVAVYAQATLPAPVGVVSVGAPRYIVEDPVKGLFGIDTREFLDQYSPVPIP